MTYNVHIILGNHDVYYKTTNDLNAIKQILGYSDFNIYENSYNLNINNVDILLLPWICEYNFKQSMEMIENTKSQICFGHLEIAGFEMYDGSYCYEGLDMKQFDKFDLVCSGHFHKKSSQKNIHYLGATHEMIWSDYNCPRGFHLLDLSTRTLEFIQNPYKLFNKILYDDKDMDLNFFNETDFSQYKDSYVKIYIERKTNPFYLSTFIDKLEAIGVIDVKVVDNTKHIVDKTNLTLQGPQDTLSLLLDEVSSVETDKTRLETLVKSLYLEAQQQEI